MYTTKPINNITIKPFNKNISKERTIQEPLPDPISNGIGKAYLMYINSKIGSGKSVLVSNLLNIYRGYFKRVYFCSSNIETNEDGIKEIKDQAYKGVFKFSQERMYDNFNDEIMKNILDDIKECKDEPDYNEYEDYFLLICDDVSTAFTKINTLITKTFLRLRHVGLCVWIISQRMKNINPSIRSQITFFISFRTENKMEIEAMSQIVDKSYDEFKELLNYATNEPYSFLYINSSTNPATFYKNLSHEIINKI
jgi:hypothetical protein